MNLQELLKENERPKKSLADSQAQLMQVTAQHEAVTAQFTESLEEKQQKISTLEHQLKLLLQKIKGSRQERIDPE
ncbi:MAG: hypothetical protein WD045_04080 [Pirellulaceae bacterium]